MPPFAMAIHTRSISDMGILCIAAKYGHNVLLFRIGHTFRARVYEVSVEGGILGAATGGQEKVAASLKGDHVVCSGKRGNDIICSIDDLHQTEHTHGSRCIHHIHYIYPFPCVQ
jgi:hypothetical protein